MTTVLPEFTVPDLDATPTCLSNRCDRPATHRVRLYCDHWAGPTALLCTHHTGHVALYVTGRRPYFDCGDDLTYQVAAL